MPLVESMSWMCIICIVRYAVYMYADSLHKRQKITPDMLSATLYSHIMFIFDFIDIYICFLPAKP